LSTDAGRRLWRHRVVAGFAVTTVALAWGSLGAVLAHGSSLAAHAAPMFLAHSSNAVETQAATLPSGFQDRVVFGGLTNPTAVRFSPDGRVFIAEQSGLVLEYDSLTDTTPSIVVDLRSQTNDFGDRGLLGLALDPKFPASPYVYLLYTYDAPPGQTAPFWNDACPTPPGPLADGCVVTSKLVRIKVSGDPATHTPTKIVGSPTSLISGQWCQQYPSHSIGDLNFGPDGELYVSAGDGANYGPADWGQFGGSPGSPTPLNPCGDPPAGLGGTESLPTAEGGSLRSQSARRPVGEPVDLNGAILRVNPVTGAAAPGNPFGASSNANKQRIVAYGLRNPFRFTIRPGTNQLWIGDVGLSTWEEIDVDPDPTVSPAKNFGWPCYEGEAPLSAYATADLCASLYANRTATGPYYEYNHNAHVVPGESCPTGGSSITGLAFYNGGSYPSSYDGALFFGDHTRNCIWAMLPGSNGLPDPTKIETFVAPAGHPVDLEIGPGGDLFYVDLDDGQIHRITYTPPLTIPTVARISGDQAKLALRCLGPGDCSGSLMIQSRPLSSAAAAKRSSQPKLVTYASAVFAIPAGQTRSVTVTLFTPGKRAAGTGRSLKAYANARLSAGHMESSIITLNWSKPHLGGRRASAQPAPRSIPWWLRWPGW
jgi:glucose/arabinose dehydrogenase